MPRACTFQVIMKSEAEHFDPCYWQKLTANFTGMKELLVLRGSQPSKDNRPVTEVLIKFRARANISRIFSDEETIITALSGSLLALFEEGIKFFCRCGDNLHSRTPLYNMAMHLRFEKELLPTNVFAW